MLSAKNIPLSSAVSNVFGSAAGAPGGQGDAIDPMMDPEERKKKLAQAGLVDGLANTPGSPVISNAVLSMLSGR